MVSDPRLGFCAVEIGGGGQFDMVHNTMPLVTVGPAGGQCGESRQGRRCSTANTAQVAQINAHALLIPVNES